MLNHAPLPPHPDGWFCLTDSASLRVGDVRTLTFAGQDVVVFRDEDGRAAVVDPYCPHLGAHLGKGGRVEGAALRCPFHDLGFAADGRCVFVPDGGPPRKNLDLKAWPVREVNGFLFAWYSATEPEPAWDIPELDEQGWTAPMVRCVTLRGHPQETTENSVDLGHLSVVHGYSNIEFFGDDFEIDGVHLHAHYAMDRANPLVPKSFGPKAAIRSDFHVHVWGLGYSLVEVCVKQWNLAARLFILSTHTDGETIHLTVGVSVDETRFKVPRWLGRWPRAALAKIMATTTLDTVVHDVMQDKEIWENKINISPPALVKGDGPIGPYRRYAKQFYSTPSLPVLDAVPSVAS